MAIFWDSVLKAMCLAILNAWNVWVQKINYQYDNQCLQSNFRVCTLFQKQISRTFPGLFHHSDWLFKGSKIHINPYTPKISMLILLTVFHTLYIFYNVVELNRFPELSRTSGLFPVLENATIKFQDFPGFPGPVQTLNCSNWRYNTCNNKQTCPWITHFWQ